MISALAVLIVFALQEGRPEAAPKRIPWVGSKVSGSPDAPAPLHAEPAFPQLHFEQPVDLVGLPGTGLMAVAEWSGRILSFPPDPSTPQARVLLTLGRPAYGLAAHPRFAENGRIYVIQEDPAAGVFRLCRYVLRKDSDWTGDPRSEQELLRWPVRRFGHGGGGLRFGPDGFLYVGIGDGSEGMDPQETGQDLGDLLGSILRIDVDGASGALAYGIPADNPFVGRPGARAEIWAYGVRQPWKLSFDRATGDLWAGEVGQDLWEMVLRVRRGGNYGWSLKEGMHPFRPDRKPGPTPLLPPVLEHPHSEFRSLIGGLVYHGTRLKELTGSYVYGDYETGKVWGVRMDGDRVARHQEFATTNLRIVGFGEDEAGELYVLDFLGGAIHRLAEGATAEHNPNFPRKLSDTGLFASLRDLSPAPGVLPYTVNASLWADHATKERHIALPGESTIGFQDLANRPLVDAPRAWGFPDGTVLVKTFSLEGRRIETRLLHLRKLADTQDSRDHFWRGYSYRWNDEQSDAELVDAAGIDQAYTVRDSKAAGGTRSQSWHFPSRSECMHCHSMPAQFVLGVTTLQMNRDIDAPGGGKVNQIKELERLGLFRTPLPSPPGDMARLVDYTDPGQDLDLRARSYLHANCAQCHTKFGGGNSSFQLQANLPLETTGILDAPPVHGALGVADARLLAPGSPERSMLYHRMGLSQAGRMPPLATSIVDEQGMELLGEWIRHLDPHRQSRWFQRGGMAIGLLIVALIGVRLFRKKRPAEIRS